MSVLTAIIVVLVTLVTIFVAGSVLLALVKNIDKSRWKRTSPPNQPGDAAKPAEEVSATASWYRPALERFGETVIEAVSGNVFVVFQLALFLIVWFGIWWILSGFDLTAKYRNVIALVFAVLLANIVSKARPVTLRVEEKKTESKPSTKPEKTKKGGKK